MELINHRESESLDFYGSCESCSIPSVELSIETPRNLNQHHPPSAFGHISGYLLCSTATSLGCGSFRAALPATAGRPPGTGKRGRPARPLSDATPGVTPSAWKELKHHMDRRTSHVVNADFNSPMDLILGLITSCSGINHDKPM